MDDLIELILDIFEGLFNGILNSRSVPKVIKYILVILLFGILVCLCIVAGVLITIKWVKILCFALAVLCFILGICKLIKVYRI